MGKKKEEEIVENIEITGVEELPEDAEVVEEVVIDVPEETVENIDLRGFKTLKDAKNYPNTPEFKKLDIGCRTEYMNWLKSITKED